MPETPKYLEKAKETYNYHRLKLTEDASWTIARTAKSLRRSIGSICEDIKIAKWSRSLPQLERLSYAYQALKMIRKKQKEYDTEEIE